MINFGRYKDQIQLFVITKTEDEFNATTETLVLKNTYRSRVLNKTTTATKDNTPSTTVVIEARIRYTPDITEQMILRHRGLDYSITSVVDYDFQEKELIITAVRG
jgi:SPP1 family predicted phage head-tail adaptor